ncbi:TonB-dependent receptor [Bacteroides helcogenes]|uniref:TonB-dependent receptor n=1 Tax=Bacteroides helcogenes (strain ATCC 35417 / DSM 20613 / JCM 6297 / CCUG 15421 / P 36-108) TaxID=693979 RepID=E6SSR9_BACT6|nr:TonB-dependent receptor [Bacteroides helcogenes]ADV43182.1 TonB-dependent receptor [Bacteroides helcogenes P 36-108]MDY5239161.1 TonB-dependent receptor [Bacteroides helcogenes]
MKKHAIAACLLTAALGVCAQTQTKDSLRVVNLDEVEIISTRATSSTPVAFTNISKEQLKKQNFGQDIPYMLTFTPSVLTTSDAGAGIGYTSIRVRGTDASRINVTTNGIPMNDAESHSIYWVNTPDFASSLQDMQIQRGAGTSTNGAGAFGASINMQTQGISSKPYAEVSSSYGSFNTHKETVKAGTGIIDGHWGFDVRLSNIQSDGYRDRASADLKSYFVQGGYYNDNTTLKFITFGGKEETYHAWDGLNKETLQANRKYNPNGEIKDDKGDVIGFYDNQIDYYHQTHYQLLLNQILSASWKLNAALHYTDGDGYYEEYKNARTLVEYGLQPFEVNGVTIEKSNLIRRKLVNSGFGGGIFSLSYRGSRLDASVGGGLNYYKNTHNGEVMWVKNYIGDLEPGQEYYRNIGRKTDGNIYAKANWAVGKGINLYADLQYRYTRYKINGNNDKWDWTASPAHLQPLAIDEKFSFFNPKAGALWNIDSHNKVYASFSVAHKEPTRNNYTDNLFAARPKAERLFDYELGYDFHTDRFNAGINLYYMNYKNQLVLNGQLNEIGEAVAENVKDSYRMGIELMAGAQIARWLRWDVNATISRNRIKDYTEYLSDINEDGKDMYSESWGISQTTRYIGTTPIAFSPDFMANSLISLDYKGFSASLQTQYVGKQYLNNAHQEDCVLNSYCVSNLSMGYTFKLHGTKSVSIGMTVYNLFDETYESNGYASGAAVYQGHGKNQIKTPDSKLLYTSNHAVYYPNAGVNALAHITLSF